LASNLHILRVYFDYFVLLHAAYTSTSQLHISHASSTRCDGCIQNAASSEQQCIAYCCVEVYYCMIFSRFPEQLAAACIEIRNGGLSHGGLSREALLPRELCSPCCSCRRAHPQISQHLGYLYNAKSNQSTQHKQLCEIAGHIVEGLKA
jgi:hypothetical protein